MKFVVLQLNGREPEHIYKLELVSKELNHLGVLRHFSEIGLWGHRQYIPGAGPGEVMTLENLHLQEVATPYSFLATFCLALLPDDRRLLRRRWQRGGGGGSKVAVAARRQRGVYGT